MICLPLRRIITARYELVRKEIDSMLKAEKIKIVYSPCGVFSVAIAWNPMVVPVCVLSIELSVNICIPISSRSLASKKF